MFRATREEALSEGDEVVVRIEGEGVRTPG